MFKKLVSKIVAVVCAALLFISVGCSSVSIKDPEKAELVIKLATRALAVTMIERKPEIACEAKQYCEDFLEITSEDDIDVGKLINKALNYIDYEINVEDELLKVTLLDILSEVNVDLGNIEIDDENFELVRIAIAAYLSGCNIKIKELGIECSE